MCVSAFKHSPLLTSGVFILIGNDGPMRKRGNSASDPPLSPIRNPALVWVLAHRVLGANGNGAEAQEPRSSSSDSDAEALVSRILHPLAKLRHSFTQECIRHLEVSVLIPGALSLPLKNIR